MKYFLIHAVFIIFISAVIVYGNVSVTEAPRPIPESNLVIEKDLPDETLIDNLPEISTENLLEESKNIVEYILQEENFPTPQGDKLTENECDEKIHASPFYWDNSAQAVKTEASLRNSGDTESADTLRNISCTPQAIWILGDDITRVEKKIRDAISSAEESNDIPVLVLYNIPDHNTLTWWSGLQSNDNYLQWIEDVAKTIGSGRTWIILEPDALPLAHNLNEFDREIRIAEIRDAVAILKTHAANARVYIDAGHSVWKSPSEIGSFLNSAGIEKADGFSLNVSNYQTTSDSIEYGMLLSEIVGNKPFVIDTSRNGIGPGEPFDWCNSRGRALGNLPTQNTANPLVDAFLWIKPPGESDGNCNDGPPAGKFWLEYALELIENIPS